MTYEEYAKELLSGYRGEAPYNWELSHKIYKDSYWGNFRATGEDDEKKILQNRVKLVDTFSIKYCLRNRAERVPQYIIRWAFEHRTDLDRYYRISTSRYMSSANYNIDHYEEYKTETGYLFINSPYDEKKSIWAMSENEEVQCNLIDSGWKTYSNLYSKNACSLICHLETDEVKRIKKEKE